MSAAFTSYKGATNPVSAVTKAYERLCGTIGTTGTPSDDQAPFTIKIS
jgi:hypothetical protein